MSDSLGATTPFLKDSKKYPLTLLYENDGFRIACGEDRDYIGHISIGVRWRKGRKESDSKQNPLGFPLRCWLIMPEDLALCILNHIKDSNVCVNKDETNKAIHEITKQIKNLNH